MHLGIPFFTFFWNFFFGTQSIELRLLCVKVHCHQILLLQKNKSAAVIDCSIHNLSLNTRLHVKNLIHTENNYTTINDRHGLYETNEKKSNRMIIRTNACRHRCNMWWQKRRMGVRSAYVREYDVLFIVHNLPRIYLKPVLFSFSSFALAKQFKGIHALCSATSSCVLSIQCLFFIKWDRAGERDYDKFIQLSVIHILQCWCVNFMVCKRKLLAHGVVSLQFRLNVYKKWRKETMRQRQRQSEWCSW